MSSTNIDTLTIIANVKGVGPVEVTVPIKPFEDAPEFIDLEAAIEAAGAAVTAAYDALVDAAYEDGPDDGEDAEIIQLGVTRTLASGDQAAA